MSADEPRADDAGTLSASDAFARADRSCPFGPSFFLGHLVRFVRDRCPDAAEHLPVVQILLTDGETLDLCHIMGVSSRWVMLAVRNAACHGDGMSVELVPYELVRRVSINSRRAESGAVGFAQTRSPQLIAAETLRAALHPDRNVGD